jgi:hypothetical protein
MNDYTGKICPYCKTEFRPGDDIIVCSECDMPHHKDCWVENQGCTTFGCLGTIKAADNTASSVTATQMNYEDSRNTSAPVNSGVVFCTRCGTQNANTSSFCSHCGNRLTAVPERTPQPPVYTQANPNNSNPYSYVNQQSNPYQTPNQYQNSGYNAYQSYQTAGVDADVQQLVGTKTEYYIPKFQMMKSQGKSSSWNWAAFWVTPYWMMYRKMYGYAAAVLAADIIISLIGSTFLSLLAFGGYITFGILGNSIYMKYLEGKANQAKAMNEPYKSQFIASNGGVNTTATVLAIIGRALLVGILLG